MNTVMKGREPTKAQLEALRKGREKMLRKRKKMKKKPSEKKNDPK